MISLKPCPFCGARATVNTRAYGYRTGTFTVTHEVGCTQCHIKFEEESAYTVKNGEPITLRDGYRKCVELWNRRVENG